MSHSEPGRLHGRFAADYDRLTREYHCYAAEVLFGLAYEYVRPGECLLDVGIGTGLSSAPFAKAGLVISGIDASEEMLAVCRSKNVAVDLRRADLSVTPWPYAARSFDHVLACGLLHFFEDLAPQFKSVARVIRPGGVLAFTIKVWPLGSPRVVRFDSGGIAVFLHRLDHVAEVATQHSFERLKAMRFFVGDEQAGSADVFCALVTRYTPKGAER